MRRFTLSALILSVIGLLFLVSHTESSGLGSQEEWASKAEDVSAMGGDGGRLRAG
ncbi:MAG: hypothetical protein JXL84_02380 [Deltaproteobacteria bacterium]|nr:hypothetical protein [Deltaproteobacteria bacterium]